MTIMDTSDSVSGLEYRKPWELDTFNGFGLVMSPLAHIAQHISGVYKDRGRGDLDHEYSKQ